MERNLVKLEDVIEVLIDEGSLLGKEEASFIKPGHGPCCTCQTCGYNYDDCVCDHNELLNKLKKLKRFSEFSFDQTMD